MRSVLFATAIVALLWQQPPHPLEVEPFAPRRAVCYRTRPPLVIDGRLDEVSWRAVTWSEPFVDIQGDARPKPRLRTRVKMLWDDDYFYIGADMEDPDLWATFTKRDSIIFHENDFEVFIDPDGDTHEYYELEINALNTVWDLMLIRPYRDGGPALNAWDIGGLKTAVHLRGTLNRPGDKDDGWSVEIAMPWAVLKEAAPDQRRPRGGEQWRINFSRVQWPLDVQDGKYVKRKHVEGHLVAEHNWVWSSHGAVAMHMPERWGYVQFSEIVAARGGSEPFVDRPSERVTWELRRLYYRQADFRRVNGRYARTMAELNAADVRLDGVQLHATDDLYVLAAPISRGMVYLRQDGKVWTQSR